MTSLQIENITWSNQITTRCFQIESFECDINIEFSYFRAFDEK